MQLLPNRGDWSSNANRLAGPENIQIGSEQQEVPFGQEVCRIPLVSYYWQVLF